jgi:hypothetical protein
MAFVNVFSLLILASNFSALVWLDDGTWLSRGEYDGSEWWEHNQLPTIPYECL